MESDAGGADADGRGSPGRDGERPFYG